MSFDDTPPHGAAAATVEEARVVSELRERRHVSRADIATAVVLGGGFLAVVGWGLVACLDATARELGLLALLAIAHVLAGRVVFESTAGMAVATQPILVVAWLVLPPMLVPVVVAAGLLTSERLERSWTSAHQLLVRSASGWHSLGGVVVLSIADVEPSLSHWPWYALALAAQFAIDAMGAIIRCSALRLDLTVLVRPLTWMYGIDLLLAPVGLTAVLAAGPSGWAVLLAMSPVGVLWLVSRDRVESFERAVSIGAAVEDALTVARTDPLTGLPNRRAWNEAVASAAVVFAADRSTEIAVVMGDLDGLKSINDELGHESGDRYLVAAAELLRRAVPPDVHVARLGGDEFGVLAVAADLDAASIVTAIEIELERASLVEGRRLAMSLGAASSGDAADVESACLLADERSMAAKAERRVARQASAGADS